MWSSTFLSEKMAKLLIFTTRLGVQELPDVIILQQMDEEANMGLYMFVV